MLIYKRVCILAAGALACAGPVDTTPQDDPPDRTVVTPHTAVAITEGQNIVYSATAQIAWNEMKTNVVGEDIRLEAPVPLVEHLNSGVATRAGLDEDDYLAMAGAAGNVTVRKINGALERKFGVRAPIMDERFGECVVAYSYLDKDLQFPHRFEDFGNQSVLYAGGDRPAQVQAFGIYDYVGQEHSPMGAQAEILRYESPADFIVRLRTTSPGHELVIARTEPRETLGATIEHVRACVDGVRPLAWRRQDTLVIPKLRASFSHSYDEIAGLYLRNEGWEEFYVHDVVQDVRFLLDEVGVSMESYMSLAFKHKGPPDQHRRMVCHAPFLLYLERRGGGHPYFAVWVANEELMIPSG